MTQTGNILGDTDGKFVLKDMQSTRQFLGGILGKSESDTDGNCFSSGKQGLRESLFFWSTKGVSGDSDGKYRVLRVF